MSLQDPVHKLTLLVHYVFCLLQLCGDLGSTVLLPKLDPALLYEHTCCLHDVTMLTSPLWRRNHKLTMLMSDSLGGSAKTLMFVNVSPTDANLDESSNSLQVQP